MPKVTDISEPQVVLEPRDTCRIMFTLKLSRGDEMVDIRQWDLWGSDHQWHPSRNGFFVPLDQWSKISLKIAELLQKP